MLEQDYEVVIENGLGKFQFFYNKDFINDHWSEFEKHGVDHTTIRLWLESRGFDNLEEIFILSSHIEDKELDNRIIYFDYKALQKAYESLKSTKLENLIIM